MEAILICTLWLQSRAFWPVIGIQNAQRHKQNEERATVEQYMGQFACHVGDHIDYRWCNTRVTEL
jgi:hypothetical protein